MEYADAREWLCNSVALVFLKGYVIEKPLSVDSILFLCCYFGALRCQ